MFQVFEVYLKVAVWSEEQTLDHKLCKNINQEEECYCVIHIPHQMSLQKSASESESLVIIA